MSKKGGSKYNDRWGKNILGEKNSECKGPELGTCLQCWNHSKGASIAGWEWERARGEGNEVRNVEALDAKLEEADIFETLTLTWIAVGRLRRLSRGNLICLDNKDNSNHLVHLLSVHSRGQVKRQETTRMFSKYCFSAFWLRSSVERSASDDHDWDQCSMKRGNKDQSGPGYF